MLPRQFHGMTAQRYWHLDRHGDAQLTAEELAAGWHFCHDWDFMLVHKSWPESECCNCNDQRAARTGHERVP
jgi:hypothetical protein